MKQALSKGPDISKHNGIVNIKKVRDAGYKRIGIRAGYGKNNIDEKYVSNALACFNLAVQVLLYWFSYAYTVAMAVAEAEFCITQAKKYWSKCPIAFDFEYDSVNYARKRGVNVTKQLATDMAIAFLQKVKAAGYLPVIYTNKDYLNKYFDMNRIVKTLGKVYVWYARYTSSLSTVEIDLADIWQYTSSGVVPGISGKCDINIFYTDFEMVSVPAKRDESCNINIQNFQKAANADGYRDAYGRKLTEDGKDGKNTQYVRKQICLQAKRVGLTYKVGSNGEVVRWWQTRCNEILGSNQDTDGRYGKTARTETIKLQKKLNLTADGKAGYNSLQAAFYN
jgi:GH25 family lysozyme M1 (1,4-beta-N-acetylmuramidase)